MKNNRHGISIGIERRNDAFYIHMKAVGKLSHEDYQVITPLLDNALQGITEPRIRAYLDITEFSGWEPRAAWDDFRLGLKHGNEFEKIAVLGNKKWQDLATKVGAWFMSGELEFFEDADRAFAWLQS